MGFKVFSILLSLCLWAAADCYKDLNLMANWKELEYGFVSDVDRQYAIDNGLVTNNTGTPIDVDVQYTRDGNLRIFTTIPRFTNGIPFTLALVSSKLGPNGPIIYPYPKYEWHNKNNADCTGITSAFRVAIDECDHMWVIDSGMVAGAQICPPQLLTIDLKTDKLINRYQYTKDVYTPVKSLFITPVVDIRDPPPKGRCQHAMVYVADVNNYGLVVYDSQLNSAWRIENKLMFADPNWGTHTIAGESFELMDGIFALSVTPQKHQKKHRKPTAWSNEGDNERYLYFHALASETENRVPLHYIDNQTIWLGNKQAMPDVFVEIGRRGVQASMEAMDSKGNIFSNSHDPVTLFAWNTRNREYNPEMFQVVANNPDQLQFASGMKVVRNPRGHEELWLSTCRFQKIAAGTQDPNEVNFRILACRTDDLLSDKICKPLGTQTGRIVTTLYSNSVH